MQDQLLRNLSKFFILSSLVLGAAPSLAADDELPIADSEMPNGTMESCKIVQKDTDVGGGQKVTVFAGGVGAFFLAVPSAPDWRVQCDRTKFFWAFSRSLRMQVSVNPHKLQSGEDITSKNYLAGFGAIMKKGIESQGVEVSEPKVLSLFKDEKGEIFGLEMSISAPEGQKSPWFPQDSFFTAREGPIGYWFDAHFTIYPRSEQHKKELTSLVHTLMGTFSVKADLVDKTPKTPVSDLTNLSKSEGPMPSFPGVSASKFSDKTVVAMRAVLECKSEKMGRYCDALNRFVKAQPLSADTDNVWAGSTLVVFASDGGKIAGAGEGIHHLYVKSGKASFNTVKPSDESEAKELKALLDLVHSGKAPSRSSGLMKYLGGFTPQEVNPVEAKPGGLSFVMGVGRDLGLQEEQLPEVVRDAPRVFVRENEKELLVVEIWGEGFVMKIGIFPKG